MDECFATIELHGQAQVERVIVHHAGADVGQGAHNLMRQIAAETVGVSLAQVELIASDTALTDNSGSTSASRMTFMAGNAMLREKTQGNYPAPKHILSCVFEGLQTDIDTGLKSETRYFVNLVLSPEAKNMIRSLFSFAIAASRAAASRALASSFSVSMVSIFRIISCLSLLAQFINFRLQTFLFGQHAVVTHGFVARCVRLDLCAIPRQSSDLKQS